VRSIGWMTYSAALRYLGHCSAPGLAGGQCAPAHGEEPGRRAAVPALPLSQVTLR